MRCTNNILLYIWENHRHHLYVIVTWCVLLCRIPVIWWLILWLEFSFWLNATGVIYYEFNQEENFGIRLWINVLELEINLARLNIKFIRSVTFLSFELSHLFISDICETKKRIEIAIHTKTLASYDYRKDLFLGFHYSYK